MKVKQLNDSDSDSEDSKLIGSDKNESSSSDSSSSDSNLNKAYSSLSNSVDLSKVVLEESLIEKTLPWSRPRKASMIKRSVVNIGQEVCHIRPSLATQSVILAEAFLNVRSA